MSTCSIPQVASGQALYGVLYHVPGSKSMQPAQKHTKPWYNGHMSPQSIVVPAEETPMRLDVFLAQHTDISRSQLQKHIKGGTVQVNGQAVNSHHKVKPGDTISFGDLTVAYHETVRDAPLTEPNILFENTNVLVINKPSGWVVHGGPSIHERTVADWAVDHDSNIATVGDRPEQRPGIVHRLDRDVSGVMVIAKTQAAFDHLKRQFQDHTIIKEYIALVLGRITHTSGRIAFAIARKKDKSGLMVARPNSKEGKEADTRFTVERYIKNFTLVRVRTLTGRSHQIRVHFKAISHPLLGDKLYRRRGQKKLRLEPPRLFLHATLLGFVDLDGSSLRFEAPLPDDLQQYLTRVT